MQQFTTVGLPCTYITRSEGVHHTKRRGTSHEAKGYLSLHFASRTDTGQFVWKVVTSKITYTSHSESRKAAIGMVRTYVRSRRRF